MSDGTADSNVATVAITVNAVNDAPVAGDDAETTDEDTRLHVRLRVCWGTTPTRRARRSLPSEVTGPSHAVTFTVNADGRFDYTPVADFNGSDSFTYTVSDGAADVEHGDRVLHGDRGQRRPGRPR